MVHHHGVKGERKGHLDRESQIVRALIIKIPAMDDRTDKNASYPVVASHIWRVRIFGRFIDIILTSLLMTDPHKSSFLPVSCIAQFRFGKFIMPALALREADMMVFQ